jgi:ATP-binding cassette subfamily F protein 3
LLLSDYNILILDEPGNHLDVDTVDALVDALVEYEGTVIFTSHDRHFTKKVATCIIEVREGRVTNYNGKYDDYVYRVNKEIEAGEREVAVGRVKVPEEVLKARKVSQVVAPRSAQEIRQEMETLERTIAQLDERRHAIDALLSEPAEADELERLCDELATVADEHDAAEAKWLALQTELEAAE